MDLAAAIDAYCERTGPQFWAEPVNAFTNLAFIVAALLMWRRTAGLPVGRVLSGILVLIGLGSFLFHTFATAWAGLADTLPIAAFILVYVYAANRSFWRVNRAVSAIGAAFFIPYAALGATLFGLLPFFRVSAPYWPVPFLIALYALLLRRRLPATARGLAAGAGLLTLSLVARTLDEPLCGAIPLGTHWIWHCLNAVMLAWMIEVWARAGRRPQTSAA